MSIDNNQALIKEIEPSITAAHERHIESLRTTPIHPVQKLASLAGTDDDPLAYGPVLRDAYNERLNQLEEQGIDARGLVAAAFLVNLLTEDNLPHYSIENYRAAEGSAPLTNWLYQWITEEDAHGTMMRDYGLLTGMIGKDIPHDQYYRGRVSQLQNGLDVSINSPGQGFTYLSLQEKVTGIAHKRTGLVLDTLGRRMLQSVSGDEERHYRFYSAQVQALLEVDPDQTVVAIHDQLNNFAMPGARGIPEFGALAKTIAVSGIYDQTIETDTKADLLKQWKIDERTFKADAAKEAQTKLIEEYGPDSPVRIKRTAQMERVRDAIVKRHEREGTVRPLIIGHTVQL